MKVSPEISPEGPAQETQVGSKKGLRFSLRTVLVFVAVIVLIKNWPDIKQGFIAGLETWK